MKPSWNCIVTCIIWITFKEVMDSHTIVYRFIDGFNMVDQMQYFMHMMKFYERKLWGEDQEHIHMIDVCTKYYTKFFSSLKGFWFENLLEIQSTLVTLDLLGMCIPWCVYHAFQQYLQYELIICLFSKSIESYIPKSSWFC